jgi:hypothetical protein
MDTYLQLGEINHKQQLQQEHSHVPYIRWATMWLLSQDLEENKILNHKIII